MKEVYTNGHNTNGNSAEKIKSKRINDKPINASKTFTSLARSLSLNTWGELVAFVAALPYGRNSNRSDFGLVLTQRMGSCSSKHALLKTIAIENEFHEVEQILGIYKMNELNTPGVGKIELTPEIDYIPEAHSYLRINGQYFDYTNEASSYIRIREDVLEEIVIQPSDVVVKKVELHKEFIEKWIQEMGLDVEMDEVWRKREECIHNLSGSA